MTHCFSVSVSFFFGARKIFCYSITMSPPAKKNKPNRDKTWRKYYDPVHSFLCGSKKIEVLSCSWCSAKGEPFQLQSVRCRCVRHLEKCHGWNEETDLFDGKSISLIISSDMEPVDYDPSLVTDEESNCTVNGTDSLQEMSDNSLLNCDGDWKKYWEPAASSSSSTRKGPVVSCQICSSKGKVYELISCSKRCSRHLINHHKWSPATDTFQGEGEPAKTVQTSSSSASCSSPSSSSSSPPVDQEKAEYLLVAWAYSSGIPPASFDNPFWKEFISITNRSMKAPSSKDIITRLKQGFNLKIKSEDGDGKL